jgi:predicted AlkP superfamily phosphohydrolase/phosphomutase
MNKKTRITIVICTGVFLITFCVWKYCYSPATKTSPIIKSPDYTKIKTQIKSNKEKILIIGVDGLTWQIILDLTKRGELPNITEMIKNSPHGKMHSEKPLLSPPIWTTFATGLPRKKHGIDNFLAKVPGKYKEVNMTSKFRLVPALWNIASWGDRSVSVVNWNAAYPAEKINGVFVAPFKTNHKYMSDKEISPNKVSPEKWRKKIQTIKPISFSKIKSNLTKIKDRQIKKTYYTDGLTAAIAKEIIINEKPDLMMVYLTGIDILSHLYWKYYQPVSTGHTFNVSKEETALYGSVITDHYEFIDHIVGELKAISPEYTLIIVSDHGEEPNYPPNNYYLVINNILERTGYLNYKKKRGDAYIKELHDQGFFTVKPPVSANLYFLTYLLAIEKDTRQTNNETMDADQILNWLKDKVQLKTVNSKGDKLEPEQVEVLLRSLENIDPGIDFSKTLAWNVSDHLKLKQGIYLNLEDREENGIVNQKEFNSIRNRLISDMLQLHTEKKNRIFSSVTVPEKQDADLAKTRTAPDIIVEINKKAMLDTFILKTPNDPDPIPIDATRWIYTGSGDHISDGVFIISGQNVNGYLETDISLYDIAPTILWQLGFPVGKDMPGKVLKHIYNDTLSKKKISYIDTWTNIINNQNKFEANTPTEPEMEQLRSLGYVEP